MAFNFATGQEEDANGNPIPSVKAPRAPLMPSPALAGPILNFPARPLRETTTEARVESPAAASARLRSTVAEGAVANARENVAGLEADAAGHEAAGATAHRLALEQAERTRRENAAKDEASRQKWIEGRRAMVTSEVEAKKKAGAARADFWDGKETAELIVYVMRGIQEGIAAFQGRGGPTAAERIAEAKIAAHEKKLVGAWEASQIARELHDKDYAEWERQRELKKAEAADQSAAELAIVAARTKELVQKGAPDRAKAAAELTTRLEELGHRRAEEQRAQTYNTSIRHTTRSESGSGGAAAASRADDTIVFDPSTGKPRFHATTPAQAKELNKTGGEMNRIRSLLQQYRDTMLKLPGLRNTLTDQEMIAREKAADGMRQGLISGLTNMEGAGVPTGGEREAFLATLERDYLQTKEGHASAMDAAADKFFKAYEAQLPAFGYQGQDKQPAAAQGAPASEPAKKAAAPGPRLPSADELASELRSMSDEDLRWHKQNSAGEPDRVQRAILREWARRRKEKP